ncbi:MAG: dihydropteroate synthase [Pyrinomonadaceae bacterium]
MKKFWETSRRTTSLEKTLVMAILNVTPDSFSDGGKFFSLDAALKQAEKLAAEGADILDIGGESTRPASEKISADEETNRVVPVVEAIAKRFEIPVSIDTSKARVAAKAVEAGAEIINDISGLRFDENVAKVAAKYKTGLVLMHLRGAFETMHEQKPVADILSETASGFRLSLEKAENCGVRREQIALDVGVGFSKTFEQNLELLAKLAKLVEEFPDYPFLVGTSRKSFIGKILGDAAAKRLQGSLTSAAIAVWNGAKIVRVHDVRETVEALKIVEAIKNKL